MSVPSLDPQVLSWSVPISVLAASFVGSPHCAAMCGPLALGLGPNRAALLAYNLGRFFSYAALGAIAGGLGSKALSGLQSSAWASTLFLLFLSALLIWMGVRTWNGKALHFRLPRRLERVQTLAWRRLRLSSLPTWATAFSGGIFTILLPCGHLYAFALGAAATGSTIKGVVFMSFFWLGTVPALGIGVQVFRSGIARSPIHRGRLMGTLLVLAGLISVGSFANRLAMDRESKSSSTPHHRCH